MIELKNVCKSYEKGKLVVNHLSMKIEKGKIIVLIGESGCGKTTTMKMINRLIESSSGQILIEDNDIKTINPIELRRRIGYVIQKVGLFPHMTVGENIEIIPRLKKWPIEKRKKRAIELLDMVDLPSKEYYSRYPSELSGGQQQRIGVARALAINPDIILMDEPFSALDPLTREQLQNELLSLQDDLNKTIVFVTHDMDEALKLGDMIAVMADGEIIQYDTPENILKNPKNEYIENFVGKDRLWKSPQMVYVKDLMNKRFPFVSINRTAAIAIEEMRKYKVRRMAVVTKRKDKYLELIGYVTKSALKKAISNNDDIKMKDIMITDTHTINENNNMLDVLSYMSSNNLHDMFVVNDKGYLTGTISESDVISLLSDYAPDSENNNNNNDETKDIS